jgi:hypothetical protein
MYVFGHKAKRGIAELGWLHYKTNYKGKKYQPEIACSALQLL